MTRPTAILLPPRRSDAAPVGHEPDTGCRSSREVSRWLLETHVKAARGGGPPSKRR